MNIMFYFSWLQGGLFECVIEFEFSLVFSCVIIFGRFDEKNPVLLQSAAILIKFLYNMVLDTFDR